MPRHCFYALIPESSGEIVLNRPQLSSQRLSLSFRRAGRQEIQKVLFGGLSQMLAESARYLRTVNDMSEHQMMSAKPGGTNIRNLYICGYKHRMHYGVHTYNIAHAHAYVVAYTTVRTGTTVVTEHDVASQPQTQPVAAAAAVDMGRRVTMGVGTRNAMSLQPSS